MYTPSSGIEERICQKATLNHIPISGSLELSPVCNLSCDMCYVRLSPSQMPANRPFTAEQWVSLAKELQEAGTMFLQLTGGEPLLYPGFAEVYSALHDMGMVLTLNTNGTLLNEEWVSFFLKRRPRRINVTLYALNEEGYEDLCHCRAGFAQTVRALHLLRDNHLDVKLNVSLTPKNLASLDDFYSFAKELGIPIEVDSYMFPFCRNGQQFSPSNRLDAKTCAHSTLSCMANENPSGRERLLEDCKLMREGMIFPNHNHLLCRAGRSSFFIDWQGNMHPCFAMKGAKCNVFTDGFSSCWEQTTSYIKELFLSSTCSSCPMQHMCLSCPGRAESETNDPSGTPEYLCQWMREISNYAVSQ